jgi:hypothetical protein
VITPFGSSNRPAKEDMFKHDILLMVLDKGLLGVILALLAFFLSRLLERFKAKQVYYQEVSKRKIDAYERINKALSRQTEFLSLIGANIRAARERTDCDAQKLAKQLVENYEQWKKTFCQTIPDIQDSFLYVSDDLAKLLSGHLNQFLCFLDSLYGISLLEAESKVREIEKEHVDIQMAIIKEIWSGPH